MTARAVLGSAGALALLLTACGISSSPTSTATSTPAATPTSTLVATPSPTPDLVQVEAAAYQIFPRGPSRDCFNGTFDGCPFTPRLTSRMQAIFSGFNGPGADPVCRCQNSYMSSSVATEVVSGRPVAHVVLTFGAPPPLKMDWMFVQLGGKWIADDSSCTAQGSSTSIYANIPSGEGPAPCSG
jgi:hypothetical protein